MSFMPVNTPTAHPTKAALAQGGFFVFAIHTRPYL
jgi:hypothetical protein